MIKWFLNTSLQGRSRTRVRALKDMAKSFRCKSGAELVYGLGRSERRQGACIGGVITNYSQSLLPSENTRDHTRS